MFSFSVVRSVACSGAYFGIAAGMIWEVSPRAYARETLSCLLASACLKTRSFLWSVSYCLPNLNRFSMP